MGNIINGINKEKKAIRPQPGGQERFVRSNVDVCFFGGVLNPQPGDELISTPDGFMCIQDLFIGDIICDANGTTQKINYIIDKGTLECVEFTLDDGRTVRSALSHRWIIENKYKRILDISSQDIIDHMDEDNQNTELIKEKNYKIPVACPAFLEDNYKDERKIEPYIFGKDINAGNISYIPKCYKYTSIENRINLLKGIMGNHIESTQYNTTKREIAIDIADIIYSIGGKCNIIEEILNDNINYKLLIKTLKENPTKYDSHLVLNIISYKYIGKKQCYCINVTGVDHLYLTNNYVITRNCGKTSGAILSVAEWVKMPNFRGLFTRRNLGDAKAGGGLVDEFRNFYGDMINVKMADSPRITFPSGAYIDITHIADEEPRKLMERVKGYQYDFIELEELTSYEWSTFNIIITRNRGNAGIGSKIRGTTNPQKNHWMRTFINDYIGADGTIKPDWDGMVRYFYIYGETVNDVAWGDSKKEVYEKCKISIDKKLAILNKEKTIFTYDNFIKSFVFYLGNMSENKASIERNKDYVGSVAAGGGKQGQILLEGNWDISVSDDDVPISSVMAHEIFLNDPQINGDRWLTADLADEGTDNFIIVVWDGFHIIDIIIRGKTTPKQNAELIIQAAKKYDIGTNNIIFDGNNGRYINDYIPNAIPFISFYKSFGMDMFNAQSLKDEAYMRLVSVINDNMLSMEKEIAKKRYTHAKLKNDVSIQCEFMEECGVVRFKKMPSGKNKLWSKEQMNTLLGKGRSMDLLDPCAMRMMPVLKIKHGDELIETRAEILRNTNENTYNRGFYRDPDFSSNYRII